jgi:hypothetical protein
MKIKSRKRSTKEARRRILYLQWNNRPLIKENNRRRQNIVEILCTHI